MNSLKISILILLCLAFTLSAQNKQYTFSLDQAVDFALDHNKTVQAAGKDIEIAEKQRWQSIATGLPQISATMDYTTQFNYMMTMQLAEGIPPVSIPLKDQSALKGTFSQLIFNGQYIQGILISKIAQQLTQQAYQENELDVKENVSSAYYLILVMEESKKVVELNIKDIETVLSHTQNMYDVGMSEITDVDQLKITVSQLKNALTELQNNISLNYNLLRFHLGLSNIDDVKLTDGLDYFLGKEVYNTLMINAFDVSQNIRYQIMETQEQLTKKSLDVQKWAFAPSIMGTYQYTEKLLTTSFDMSPKQVLNFTMSIPILSSWDRMSKTSQAKIELEKMQLNKNLVHDQLLLEESQLRTNLKNAVDNYFLQSENVEVAKRVFQNYRNKYEFGILSSLELTQANSNYLTAQTNYLTSAMNLLQAQLKLQKLLNTL